MLAKSITVQYLVQNSMWSEYCWLHLWQPPTHHQSSEVTTYGPYVVTYGPYVVTYDPCMTTYGPYVVTSDDSYVQGMAVLWHGSIASDRLEVPAAGAYRQVHCPLSTSLCTVMYYSSLYCTAQILVVNFKLKIKITTAI